VRVMGSLVIIYIHPLIRQAVPNGLAHLIDATFERNGFGTVRWDVRLIGMGVVDGEPAWFLPGPGFGYRHLLAGIKLVVGQDLRIHS